MPRYLLAKSSATEPPPSEARLQGHTASVVAAADSLLRARGMASLRAVGLGEASLPRLERIVRLSAFVHDIGKASVHFQEMLRGLRAAPQLLRHELVSLLLAWREPLRTWLSASVAGTPDYVLACAAAAGHHRKYSAHAIAPEEEGAGLLLECFVAHQDFRDTLRLGASKLRLPEPPALERTTFSIGLGGDVRPAMRAFEAAVRDVLDSDPVARPLLAIAKALVLDADVAGSALPRADEGVGWIAASLSNRAGSAELEGVVRKRLGTSRPRPFQERVAATEAPVTLVRAGCGSGKTLAAYLWAARRHPGKQLWVTYPTTGTAAEGFRGYAHESGIDARLESSRARVDLELLDLDDDGVSGRLVDRLETIRVWGTEAVVCTVDTVLGLIQNQRKGLYAWAGLADSAVVFDEIHAYDDRLFGALLRFLECLPGIPALLMTASLPAIRQEALAALVLRRHGRELPVVEGPADLEALPRYRVSESDDAVGRARAAAAAGGKVLWVSNTVDRCIGSAASLDGAACRPLVYHSRFRYEDRVRRHRDVVAAFGAPGAAIACTTQVAEMSLDLSADLLVTDLAPVPALIQRLGRLNRRSTPERPEPVRDFVVLAPARPLPYEAAELANARDWLAALRGRDLGQKDLIDAWGNQGGVAEAVESAWWDGGSETEPAGLREPSPGITVLLQCDAAAVRARPADAARFALPMNQPPPRINWRSWQRLAYIPVAPVTAIDYDAERGARWAA